jgi:hypothetical protein
MDRYLDSASGGPLYLKQQPIAQHLQSYETRSIRRHGVKGYTARELNRLLGPTGQPFWQVESHDRSVRDDRESNGWTRGQRGRLSLVERGKKSRDESRLSRLDSLRHDSVNSIATHYRGRFLRFLS